MNCPRCNAPVISAPTAAGIASTLDAELVDVATILRLDGALPLVGDDGLLSVKRKAPRGLEASHRFHVRTCTGAAA